MQQSLADCMPDFDWVTMTLDRPAETKSGRIEPVSLLEGAEIDRDVHEWDFVFVVTALELRGRERLLASSRQRLHQRRIW